MIFDRRIIAKVKGQVYMMVVRPAMMSGLATVAQKKDEKPTGSSRVEHANIFTRSDEDGPD